jgi:hypothetical protein
MAGNHDAVAVADSAQNLGEASIRIGSGDGVVCHVVSRK